ARVAAVLDLVPPAYPAGAEPVAVPRKGQMSLFGEGLIRGYCRAETNSPLGSTCFMAVTFPSGPATNSTVTSENSFRRKRRGFQGTRARKGWPANWIPSVPPSRRTTWNLAPVGER